MGLRYVTLLYQTKYFWFRPWLLAHLGTPPNYYGRREPNVGRTVCRIEGASGYLVAAFCDLCAPLTALCAVVLIRNYTGCVVLSAQAKHLECSHARRARKPLQRISRQTNHERV